jgi:DNA ligase (NAD+)
MNNKILDQLLKDPYKFAHSVPIDSLVDVMQKLSEQYYNTGISLVSDEVYDILRDVLAERDPVNPYLKQVGAPLTKEKVKLPFFMPSLDKIKPTTDALDKWMKKFKGDYVISDKLDGVSAMLFKDNNNMVNLYTRGDGVEGQDITHLIPFFFNEKVQFAKMPKGGAVRGELIISKKNFQKISKNFKNARNAVAGLVNSKHYSKDVASVTDFIAYAVLSPELSQIDQMKQIEKWQIPIVTYAVKKSLTNDMLSQYLGKRRMESDYEVDGIVVIDSSKAYPNTLDNPDYGFAFKTILTDQVAEATVVDVIWDISKHGLLKPTVQIQPVNLVGVEITFATAFNAKFVEDNKLGPGAVIKLVRSGDVIPHILEVIKPSASGKPKMPDTSYEWNKTHIDIIAKDVHGARKDRIIVKQLTSFFRYMNVKYLSEGLITKIVEAGYKTVVDIIKAKDKLTDIEGIGTKMVDKVFTNIDNAFRNATLYQLMAASNAFGIGFGIRKCKLITDTYPNIMKSNWTKDEMIQKIKEIDGFDTLTATRFADNFGLFKTFMEKLEKIVDLTHLAKVVPKVAMKKGNVVFKDMIVVFTGIRDKNLEKTIEDNGGKVASTVSSKTTAVVYSDKTTSKYQKAVELGIDTYTLDEFKKKYTV